MTDKEKIELKDGVISIFKRFNILDHTATIGGLRDDIIRYINSLQEEPKQCMYSKDNYTDEDRKVLCDGCEEECEYNKKEEPASEDLEKIVEEIAEPTILNAYGTKELARRLRNTICGISISEDLGEYINELSKQFPEVSFAKLSRIAVRVAKWKNEQIMAKAIDVEVKVDAGGYPYIPQMELYDYDKDIPLAKKGDRYKVILIKEG